MLISHTSLLGSSQMDLEKTTNFVEDKIKSVVSKEDSSMALKITTFHKTDGLFYFSSTTKITRLGYQIGIVQGLNALVLMLIV